MKSEMKRFGSAATKGFLLLCLCGCQPYGCQPGFSTPADASRDLAAFNKVLAASPAFRGIKATAVHGHEVDVIDADILKDSPGTIKYSAYGGIDDKLRDAWAATFARLHPFAYNRNIVDIEVRERQDGYVVMGISSGGCATL
jgi:hypothetical protein